jgi:hypothetical protein
MATTTKAQNGTARCSSVVEDTTAITATTLFAVTAADIPQVPQATEAEHRWAAMAAEVDTRVAVAAATDNGPVTWRVFQ